MREFPNATPRPWSVDDPYIVSLSDAPYTEIDVCEVFGGREMREANAALMFHAVNTYEDRERLLEQAEMLVYDMAAILDLHKLAPSKLEAARAFLAKLEARDA